MLDPTSAVYFVGNNFTSHPHRTSALEKKIKIAARIPNTDKTAI